MQITAALDGSLVRNLRLSPGDEVTLDLTVYEHDGDTTPLAYTDPQMSVGGGSLYPIGTEFTVSLTLGRTPYQLAVQIDGVTTTVAYGIIETTMPGSCSIVCCWPPGGGSSGGGGGGTSYQPLSDNLTQISALEDPDADRLLFWDDSEGAFKFLTLGTNLSITGDTIDASGGGGSGDVVGPASAVNNRVVFFDGTSGKLIKDSGLTLVGTNTGDQTSVSGNAGTATALATARTLAITGDLAWTSPSFDGSANVTAAGTLATVNSNVGSFGSATQAPQVTVNAKGLVTAASNVTVTPAVGSITGLGTGIATALGVNVGSAGAPVLLNGAGGTPSSLTLTNATGLPVPGGGTGRATLTANAVVVGDGTNQVKLAAPGADGTVLTMVAGVPAFAAAAGGGGWVKLSAVTAAASATVDVDTTFSSTYDVYAIHCSGVQFSAGGTFQIQLKIGGSYVTANYEYVFYYPGASGSPSGNPSAAQATSSIQISDSTSGTTSRAFDLTVYVFNPSRTTAAKQISWSGTGFASGSQLCAIWGAGMNTGTAALTGVRFSNTGGNIQVGYFELMALTK